MEQAQEINVYDVYFSLSTKAIKKDLNHSRTEIIHV